MVIVVDVVEAQGAYLKFAASGSAVRFVPTLIPTVAAFIGIALTSYLGHWQQGRAEEKRALQARYVAASERSVLSVDGNTTLDADAFRRAVATGQWDPEAAIFIDNKIHNGQAGFHVVQPMQLGSNKELLVNVGWIARDARYPAAPMVNLPQGAARVEGLLVAPSTRYLELQAQTRVGRVWQNLDIAKYAKETQRTPLPLVLHLRQSPPGFVPVLVEPDAGVNKHLEYMLTWYSLAVTVLALWIFLNLKRQ